MRDKLGITPYGTDALSVLRVEKGHVAGPELNGTTTAADLGLGKMMSKRKEFVGRVMAGREALVAPDRQVVVGVKPVDKVQRLRSGAHVIPKGAVVGPETDQGYVTSVCYSPVVGQWIGLALIERGRERVGEIVRATIPCAAKTMKWRSATGLSTIPTESGNVAEYTWLERPLVARKAIPARDGDIGIRLREVQGFSLNLLMVRRGRRDAVAEAAVKVFGMSMPRPGQTAVGGDTVLVWSSADQFLVLQRHNSPAALRENFAGLASISDQSDGRRLLELSGSRVRDLLAKLTSVDLTERVFRSEGPLRLQLITRR